YRGFASTILVLFAALPPSFTFVDLLPPSSPSGSGTLGRRTDRLRQEAPKNRKEREPADDQTNQNADKEAPRPRAEPLIDRVSPEGPGEQTETNRNLQLQPQLEHLTTRETSR